jgi:hypothetical protein
LKLFSNQKRPSQEDARNVRLFFGPSLAICQHERLLAVSTKSEFSFGSLNLMAWLRNRSYLWRVAMTIDIVCWSTVKTEEKHYGNGQ